MSRNYVCPNTKQSKKKDLNCLQKTDLKTDYECMRLKESKLEKVGLYINGEYFSHLRFDEDISFFYIFELPK